MSPGLRSDRVRTGALRLLLGVMLLWSLLPLRGLSVCFGEDGHFRCAPRLTAELACPCETHALPAPDDAAPHGPCEDLGVDRADAISGDGGAPAACDWTVAPPPPAPDLRMLPERVHTARLFGLPRVLPPPRIPRVLRL